MRRVRSARWGSIHESDRVRSFGALDRAPKFSPVPASMRCNSHAKSFSYAGSDSSEGKRIGHDEEVIDPATPSPEIWQESDSIDNKLGPSSSVRQCEVLIDLSTCADMFFRDHVQSSSHRKIAALLRSQLPRTHHDLRPTRLKRVEMVRCLIWPARHGNRTERFALREAARF